MTQKRHEFPFIPERYQGYVDYFGENPTKNPIILEDGTSVSFPEGWTDEDADKWRKGMELQPPGYNARVTYH